jgi:xylulokinase
MLCGLADGMDALRAQGLKAQRVLIIGGAARSEAVQEIAPSIFGAPVTVPTPLEYVALGAARQAAWALRSRSGDPDLPDWTASPLMVLPLRDPDAGHRVRVAYSQLRETVHPH